jgi:energy-coupling factor transporter ATP-binding protein EcfA2
MRVIEFVGLPGSGKTTTLRELQRISVPSTRRQFRVTERIKRSPPQLCSRAVFAAAETALAVAQYPRLSREILEFARHERGLSSHMLLQSTLAMRLAWQFDRKRRGISGGTLIADQGLVQLVGSLSIPAKTARPPAVNTLADALCVERVDGVIWLDCRPDVALDRVRRRRRETNERSRFADVALQCAPDFALEGMSARLASVVGALAKRHVPILYLSSDCILGRMLCKSIPG